MTGQAGGEQMKESIWLVALYDEEDRANELLERLSALGIDTTEATTVRVEIDDRDRQRKIKPVQDERPMSPVGRNSITGALIGSATALIAGIFIYSTDILTFDKLGGLFNHAIVAVIIGAATGALLGAILALRAGSGERKVSLPQIPTLKSDGFLVAVKMAPRYAERAEEIARRLGAKQILL